MAIIITLDVMMAKRKIRSKQLAAAVGITEANLSLMKNGKIKGIKLNTVERLCKALECQPGDLFCYEEDSDHE
ncbi:helix-turn-helix transcriptional regulator [Yersinia massiliensis]|uniref:Transcriptional regulator n=2 Tax=Yersinia TaxID=629 RepID=A0A2R4NL98_9GAMM|nr:MULTISPECIES: helix-turn-helix transcriptional regulator [Yersinia]HEC1651227.1 helix-turn-helix transcriptional regulator [Yersinia enterocolitica]ATM87285.1 transcriptional regulator [Yersinia frederiksenii]AVX36910.1 transcriptional regulator [Yersinia massiliensis]MCB5317904.1 helix-turn-helix transcriptional regulator [Yersinia massiliensis]MDA5548977.1 helix-turn-helix transcriptional regulator [Yersinia massiliensis]